jgi:hypothetical protein
MIGPHAPILADDRDRMFAKLVKSKGLKAKTPNITTEAARNLRNDFDFHVLDRKTKVGGLITGKTVQQAVLEPNQPLRPTKLPRGNKPRGRLPRLRNGTSALHSRSEQTDLESTGTNIAPVLSKIARHEVVVPDAQGILGPQTLERKELRKDIPNNSRVSPTGNPFHCLTQGDAAERVEMRLDDLRVGESNLGERLPTLPNKTTQNKTLESKPIPTEHLIHNMKHLTGLIFDRFKRLVKQLYKKAKKSRNKKYQPSSHLPTASELLKEAADIARDNNTYYGIITLDNALEFIITYFRDELLMDTFELDETKSVISQTRPVLSANDFITMFGDFIARRGIDTDDGDVRIIRGRDGERIDVHGQQSKRSKNNRNRDENGVDRNNEKKGSPRKSAQEIATPRLPVDPPRNSTSRAIPSSETPPHRAKDLDRPRAKTPRTGTTYTRSSNEPPNRMIDSDYRFGTRHTQREYGGISKEHHHT